jgi:hypothetical protein
MIVCIFEHVQWRWAVNDRLAPGLGQPDEGVQEEAAEDAPVRVLHRMVINNRRPRNCMDGTETRN